MISRPKFHHARTFLLRWWWLLVIDGIIGTVLGSTIFAELGGSLLDGEFWRTARWTVGPRGLETGWQFIVGTSLSTLALAPFLITWIAGEEDEGRSAGSILWRGMTGGILFPFVASCFTGAFVTSMLAFQADRAWDVLVLLTVGPGYGALAGGIWGLMLAPSLIPSGAVLGAVTAGGVLARRRVVGTDGGPEDPVR